MQYMESSIQSTEGIHARIKDTKSPKFLVSSIT